MGLVPTCNATFWVCVVVCSLIGLMSEGSCIAPPCKPCLHLLCLQVHHVLQIRGQDLIVWNDLTPQEAYYLQAKVGAH